MSLPTIRALLLNLGLLVGLGVGGWFLGAGALAHEAGTAAPIIVTSQVEGQTGVSGALIVPRSGLSPFGQHSGLAGRQILVGRVSATSDEGFTAVTAAGEATFNFQDSPFLLRLARGRAAAITPGAAIAALVSVATEDGAPLQARSVLVLPPEARPQLRATPPGPALGAPPPLPAAVALALVVDCLRQEPDDPEAAASLAALDGDPAAARLAALGRPGEGWWIEELEPTAKDDAGAPLLVFWIVYDSGEVFRAVAPLATGAEAPEVEAVARCPAGAAPPA